MSRKGFVELFADLLMDEFHYAPDVAWQLADEFYDNEEARAQEE